MKNIFKKLATKLAIAAVLVVTLVPSLSAFASHGHNNNYKTPKITSDYAFKDSNGKLRLSYCLSEDAYVTAGIYKAKGTNSSKTVKLLTSYDFKSEGCHTEKWNKSYSTAKKTTNLFYGISATSIKKSSKSDYVSEWIGRKGYSNNNYYYNDDYYDYEEYEEGYADGYEDGWYRDDYEYDYYDDDYYYDDYEYDYYDDDYYYDDDDYYYYDDYDNNYYYDYNYGNNYYY